MARALSQDLRDRVVGAIEGGLSCRAAAARFGVGAATAVRWRQLALRHGRAVAKSQGGDKRSARIEAHADFLLALVEDEGDPTLAEIQARLAERGTPVGIGTLWRFFDRHQITRKKRPATRLSRIAPMS
jgi:transposase